MVERFNGRIADVLATHRFRDAEDLTSTLLRYVNALQPSVSSISSGRQDTRTSHETVAC
jgi:hypothetical protein